MGYGVRHDLLKKLREDLVAIAGVAKMIDEGEDDLKLGDVPADEFALELITGEDRPLGGDRTNIELFEFDVFVNAVLPTDLAEFADGGDTKALKRQAAANEICSRIYEAIIPAVDSDGPFIGGHARNVECELFCAGLIFLDNEGVATSAQYVITYGFARGNPRTAR